MEALVSVLEAVGLFVAIAAGVVGLGSAVGIYFCLRNEEYARREIRDYFNSLKTEKGK